MGVLWAHMGAIGCIVLFYSLSSFPHLCSLQWTLLTFSASLGRDPFSPQGTPLPSRHAFGIKNAVRPSPFPSPMITPNDHTSFVPGSLGRNGAFVPYERSRRREKELSVRSLAMSVCVLIVIYAM